MTELTQMRPGDKSRLADDVVAYLRSIGREDLIGEDTVLDDNTAADGLAAYHDEMNHLTAAEALTGTAAQGETRKRRLPTGKTVTAAAFGVLLVGIQTVVQAESWRGLADFARLIHITGTEVQGVPLTLDGVSTTAALLALRAELSDESSTRERAAMYAFTFASSAANYWAGSISGGTQGALYFGGMSLAVMFVFDMLLRQIRLAVRRNAGRRGRKMPQFGLLQWIRYPRLTFRAGSIALAEGVEDPQEALDAAKTEAEFKAETARAEAEAAAIAAMDLPVLPIDAAVLAGMNATHRLAVAFGVLGKTDIPAAVALLKKHGAPVDSSHAYKIRPQILEGGQS